MLCYKGQWKSGVNMDKTSIMGHAPIPEIAIPMWIIFDILIPCGQ